MSSEESFQNTEKMYIMALHDMCARIDLAVSSFLNTITELNNAKNHYLKVLGQIRQEQELKQKQPS